MTDQFSPISVLTNTNGTINVTPTDITAFIRLDQCERNLRLQLHLRNGGSNFWRENNIAPQRIAPLLSLYGGSFEAEIEAGFAPEEAATQATASDAEFDALQSGLEYSDYGTGAASARRRAPDNARLIEEILALANGKTKLLLQPRLSTPIGDWQLRGDMDILRIARDENGKLHLFIADVKRSAKAKNEHRLQLAFYERMLRAFLDEAGIRAESITTGVLFRGVDDAAAAQLSVSEQQVREEQRRQAQEYFGQGPGFLEITPDQNAFLEEVESLVLAQSSRAARVATAPFESIPFHLAPKCDGCSFNQFCLKWAAQHDDLSLIPHLSASDKSALLRGCVTTATELAHLKELPDAESGALATPPEKRAQVQQLAATWPVGPRLDELIHRARRYRRFKEKGSDQAIAALNYIPSKGYGSLPFCSAEHNPNLVRIYIEAQHDYLHDRVYALSALVVAAENGEVARRKSVVQLLDGVPDEAAKEERLLADWAGALLQAVAEIVVPDENGELAAPVHLIFWNALEQGRFLEALGRHSGVLLSTPLYDFVTQMAAFDSPVATFLQQEIRELKNFPLLCQNMTDVAGFLGFDWKSPYDFRQIFNAHLFDAWRREEEPSGDEIPTEATPRWFTARARFNSALPLEYAYAAWGALPEPGAGYDVFAPYRLSTPENLRAFLARRLEALEHITGNFRGNHQTLKTPFRLPDLTNFECKAQDLAQALDEFVTIERHVELAAWKSARLAPPERRVLAGETLIVRYLEADQKPEVAERNRENETRRLKHEAWKAANPDTKRRPKDVMEETRWDMAGMHFRLRLECEGLDCHADRVLALSTLREGARVVVFPRWTQDSRLPEAERVNFTPTPKQLLYAMRADITDIEIDETNECAFIEVEIAPPMSGGKSRGFVFGGSLQPLYDGVVYTLDGDPNDWQGNNCSQLTQDLCDGAQSTLLHHLTDLQSVQVHWPPSAAAGQQKFLDGLDALKQAGAFHELEDGKRDFIARHGEAGVLLVQGPPGTGKSYSTAFALLARMQGAMAADMEFRIGVSCRNHAATDVLMENILKAQTKLRGWAQQYSELFARFFDARLLEVPVFRLGKRETVAGATPLPGDNERETGEPQAFAEATAHRWCFLAGTPGGTRRLLKDAKKDLFGTPLCGCIVLDEASQMSLPEAVMATLTLREDGQLIIVGDHRQMPPIIKHNWDFEPRRTFTEFKSYASLFEAFLALETGAPPKINFEESFRLHTDMAEFLRQEIYHQDGINYRSHQTAVLKECKHEDDFTCAVLTPHYPLVVVVHDEARSLLSNRFEQDLMLPILHALADKDMHNLDPTNGLGIVVPHRAQKATLQNPLWNVDTVERFQGDERVAIVVGATESDPEYLLVSGKFLLDPRRLTVALSRAKQKMILVASRSVFEVFSADEEIFQNSQIWKNLLRRTCTVPLWSGERDDIKVEVWGNTSPLQSRSDIAAAAKNTNNIGSMKF